MGRRLVLPAWIGLFATAALHAFAPARADAPPTAGPRQRVVGSVLSVDAKAVPGLMVFAADAETDLVASVAVSDKDGVVEFFLPARRHNFGVLSASIGVRKMVTRPGAHFELVVGPLVPDPTANTAAPPAARIDAPRAFVLRGRIVDQSGHGLEGIRVAVANASGPRVATVFSGPGGSFAVMIPRGKAHVHAIAPGLTSLRSAHQRGRLVIVMSVAAETQELAFVSGHTISFRPSDSIDPEYTPPAPVRAWLQYAYGICAISTPLKAREKRALRKYWYLDVLRREPPNPATVSTITCTTPSAFQPQAYPTTTSLGGFEIAIDAVPAGGITPGSPVQ